MDYYSDVKNNVIKYFISWGDVCGILSKNKEAKNIMYGLASVAQ